MGATADDDKVQFRLNARLQHLAFGEFKSKQDAAADLGGVFKALEAGSEPGPLVVPEVGVRGAGGDDEVVVLEAGAGVEQNAARSDVESDDLVHEDFGVGMAAQDAADGLRDICRR